jgi:hypothetical protein
VLIELVYARLFSNSAGVNSNLVVKCRLDLA